MVLVPRGRIWPKPYIILLFFLEVNTAAGVISSPVSSTFGWFVRFQTFLRFLVSNSIGLSLLCRVQNRCTPWEVRLLTSAGYSLCCLPRLKLWGFPGFYRDTLGHLLRFRYWFMLGSSNLIFHMNTFVTKLGWILILSITWAWTHQKLPSIHQSGILLRLRSEIGGSFVAARWWSETTFLMDKRSTCRHSDTFFRMFSQVTDVIHLNALS